MLQDSRAKYGKFVRPSRLIEEKKQTLEEDFQTNSLAAEHEEVVEASGKVFESGEKSRWEKFSDIFSKLFKVEAILQNSFCAQPVAEVRSEP